MEVVPVTQPLAPMENRVKAREGAKNDSTPRPGDIPLEPYASHPKETAMNFSDITLAFAESIPGTDAFERIKNQTRALIDQDPPNACAYYLIYGFARSYVLLYEDQAVSPDFADGAKAQLLSYLRRIEESLVADDPNDMLATLSGIVSHYVNSKRVF